MFQRILGLDIGSSSIKLVLMQKGFKGPTIERCVAWPIPEPGFDPTRPDQTALSEQLQAALVQAQLRTPAGGPVKDSVIALLEQRVSFTHTLRFPFSDSHQIGQTVAYEMEGRIPVDLEDVVVDYHPTRFAGSGADAAAGAEVLAFAFPRDYLRRRLEALQRAGVDPKMFELDGLALFNFYRQYLADADSGPGDLALLDIGDSKTSLCIVSEESPRMVRTVWQGGRHLTQALAAAMSISSEEAEGRKKSASLTEAGGLANSGACADEERMSGTLKEALSGLIKELQTTFHFYRTQSGREVRNLYACGGTSRLPGLTGYLAGRLQLRRVTGPGIPDESTFAVGIGLGLKECLGQKASRVSFRVGEFAYQKERTQARHRLKVLAVAFAVLALLGAGNLYARYHVKQERYAELKAQVRSIFTETFPEVRTIVNELEQTKVARRELDKKMSFFGSRSATVLDLLTALTRGIPEGSQVEVQSLVIEQDAIRMEAQTDSFDSVEKFKDMLEKLEGFESVVISDAKLTANQAKVRFRMNITLAEGHRT